jgi:phosphoglycerate dehydrogenase-like enzyme
MNIVVSEGLRLSLEQTKRLESLGECTIYDKPAKSNEESLKRFEEADIICTESAPIENVIYNLKDKLVCFPFVGMHWLDHEKLKKNSIKVANTPGCNKTAVTEWIVAMMILLSRELYSSINKPSDKYSGFPQDTKGLAFRKVTILGRGNIGKHVGEVCELMGMNVRYFTRNDDLIESVKDADFIVNCLATNEETKGLLSEDFFDSLKEGAYFVSITDEKIYDIDALKKVLDSGRVAGTALDPAGITTIGDSSDPLYRDLTKHPKILVTPHIAFNSDVAIRVGNDIMIDNAEAWIKVKPINIVI